MNTDGRPHSNREFRRIIREVIPQLSAAAAPLCTIVKVVDGMVRHENRKRILFPVCVHGEPRGPVPRNIVNAALTLATQPRRGARRSA